MSDIAIQVKGVGKMYRIGGKQERYKRFTETMMDALIAPIRRLRRIGQPIPAAETIWALKDISFEVKQGEVVGIIGRNGAGKSTLLKVLSRITEPTEGGVDLYGRVGSLLEVGTGFHPELTGRENVYLYGAILGMKRAEIVRKFDEIVAFAGVEKFIDTPMKRYSSGMQVRLAFSVAAHLEAEMLLVDEVLAVGDAGFQKKCLGKMESVANTGRTVLFVSHNMAAVERMCQRGILLENGQIVMDAPVQKVTNAYLQSGMKQSGERIWSNPNRAPGDDVVRLRAVRVLNVENQVTTEFKVTEAFCIEIEFQVLKPDYLLDAGLYLYDESGTLVFMTSDFQDMTWHNRSRPVGLHRSICHVPGNLLNEGSISVTAGIATNPHTARATEPNAITFRLIDDMELGGARGHYVRVWPGGAVRPLFRWTFDFEAVDDY